MDTKIPYYLAYEKRYKAVYASGATLWGHKQDDAVLIKTLTDWVTQNKLQGKRIIEYACGEGSIGVILSKFGCIYTGIDIAPSAVERAQQALSDYPNAKVRVMDMVSENVNGIFDAAVDVMGLHMIITDIDRKKYLGHVNNSLKQGSPVLFFRESYNETAYSGKVSSFKEWQAITGDDYETPSERQVTNNGITYTINIPLVPARAKRKDDYMTEMNEAGFIIDRFVGMDPSSAILNAACIYAHKGGADYD